MQYLYYTPDALILQALRYTLSDMPRYDGYPTNRELLVDFAAASHRLYIDAYETHIESKVPPAYQDKPISTLGFEVIKRYLTDTPPVQSVTTERLSIFPLTHTDIETMQKHNPSREFPADVFEFYEAIATRLAETALSNTVRFDSIVPVGSITAAYVFSHPSAAEKRVDTLKNNSTKQAIVAARYFAEEGLTYIHSGESSLAVEQKLRAAIRENRDGVWQHTFTLRMSPELPLNGHEGLPFLHSYRDKIETQLNKKQEFLEFLMRYDAPKDSLEKAREQVNRFQTALQKVQTLLDKQ